MSIIALVPFNTLVPIMKIIQGAFTRTKSTPFDLTASVRGAPQSPAADTLEMPDWSPVYDSRSVSGTHSHVIVYTLDPTPVTKVMEA